MMSGGRINWIAAIAAVGTLLGGAAALIAVVRGDQGAPDDRKDVARALAQYETACLAQVKSGTELGKGCNGDSVCLDVVFAQAERDRQVCRCASEKLGRQFGAPALVKIAKIETVQARMSLMQEQSAEQIGEATKYTVESREIANASDDAQRLCLSVPQ